MKKYLALGFSALALTGCGQEPNVSSDIDTQLETFETRLEQLETDLSSVSEVQPLVEFEESLDLVIPQEATE